MYLVGELKTEVGGICNEYNGGYQERNGCRDFLIAYFCVFGPSEVFLSCLDDSGLRVDQVLDVFTSLLC